MGTIKEAPVKMVRFNDRTNRGMIAYRPGRLYPADASVQQWLKKALDPSSYEFVDAPMEKAEEPDALKAPKVSSRLASSRRKVSDV